MYIHFGIFSFFVVVSTVVWWQTFADGREGGLL